MYGMHGNLNFAGQNGLQSWAQQHQQWVAQQEAIFKQQLSKQQQQQQGGQVVGGTAGGEWVAKQEAIFKQQLSKQDQQQQAGKVQQPSPRVISPVARFNELGMPVQNGRSSSSEQTGRANTATANDVLQKLMQKYVNESHETAKRAPSATRPPQQISEDAGITSLRITNIQTGMPTHNGRPGHHGNPPQSTGQRGHVRSSFTNSNSSNGNGTQPSFDFSLQSLKFGRLEHGNHVGAVETKSLAAFSQDARHNNITEQNTTQSAVCDTGGGLERSVGGGHEYQPLASRPSILSSPRLNSRPASAPHYPRDDDSEDIPSPRFVPAEKYQLQVHQTAALAMNSGNWQKLMVTADGSYQKQEPWSPAWIESRGLIRAWLEFQAQSDEDLRAVKEFPGVRQHTHHNEVSITQQKHLPDRPKNKRGRQITWADETQRPDHAKKPTTPRDPRAFADRVSSHDHQEDPKTPVLSVSAHPLASQPDGLNAHNANTQFSFDRYYAASPSMEASESQDSAPRLSQHQHAPYAPYSDDAHPRAVWSDQSITAYSRAHHHRLRRPWGERQASELWSQQLGRARLDLSVLSTPISSLNAAATSADPSAALARLKLGDFKPTERLVDLRADASGGVETGGPGRDRGEKGARTVLHF